MENLKDLKLISYVQLKKFISVTQDYWEMVNAIDDSSLGTIQLWDNEQLSAPANEIIDYLDDLFYSESGETDEAYYFTSECEYGNKRDKDGNPMSITVNDKKWEIVDFDSWYKFLSDNYETVEEK